MLISLLVSKRSFVFIYGIYTSIIINLSIFKYLIWNIQQLHSLLFLLDLQHDIFEMYCNRFCLSFYKYSQ